MTKYKMLQHVNLLYFALIMMSFFNRAIAESTYITPARILAKQTGATHFEEERYETQTNCNDQKHHLRKRASDEDVDYEVYQGVVGRPGIDFPIYPRIPKTTFSCRSYGNGYFADMETDCQVFHICEEGRKISFLCPNGTIFQQSELTCDWWFKVNCLGSSGYYAESAEILSKQRVHKVRPSVPVQGFNIVGGGLNIKPKVTPLVGKARSNPHSASKSDRRIDSTEDIHVSLDFDDVSGEKQHKVIPNIESNAHEHYHETQITAESSSFVSSPGKKRTGSTNTFHVDSNNSLLKPAHSRSSILQERTSQFRERPRHAHRGQQRYKDTDSQELQTAAEIRSKENVSFTLDPHSSSRVVQQTTPSYVPNSYSTARRHEPSKTTPFYTPTVPSISKLKSTDSKLKGAHINSTTPNPNRFNGVLTTLLLDSSKSPKSSSLEVDNIYRPVVIGMRHYDMANSEEQLKQLPAKKLNVIRDYLDTTVVPTVTSNGPTYLPKSSNSPRATAANEDALLFAPNPASVESIYRNVQEMLKTVSLLKDKFKEGTSNTARAGLDIPPSSGPDALVSLAKYFAQEQNDSANSLNSPLNNRIVQPKIPVMNFLPATSPSDSTVTLTTSEAPPNISEQADDIKQSLLSAKTVQKYSNLFGLKTTNGRQGQSGSDGKSYISLDVLSNATQSKASQNTDYQQFPQVGSTGSSISELAEQPDSRKIAQIFSNALSSYLDSPGNFRAELAARARPTEPTNVKVESTTYSMLFSDGTAKYYLPTKTTHLTSASTPQNIAVEINHKFDSTLAPESSTTTDIQELTTKRSQSLLELSAELSPNSSDSGEGNEFLLQQQTQSFVKSRNDLLQVAHPQKLITTIKPKPTEYPWTLKSQTDFLDPLTINDALMKEQRTTTMTSPFNYLPRSLGTPTVAPMTTGVRYEWEDIFKTYDIPHDALPSSSGLQRIANKLFGGLNEQEALHLRNVMAKAEQDRQVLSLLLLLIQTCDDHNGKALERSRKHLLNALIDIDSKSERKNIDLFKQKSSAAAATTSRMPLKTLRGSNGEFYTSTATPRYTTSTELPLSTSTTNSGSFEETTKFEIHVEDVEDVNLAGMTAAMPLIRQELNSDRRALELLKSLYSLASKFSSRR
ncbi:uncharacterized protein LOC108603737 isoform X2 [Drosophila busckii]|uniref:uncharacterized protein LOC108603737 isoform X2 n=1 Tax=Drosophila busckii TaxID=30019 RepID=UPI00083F0D40|nr:uncharacterized protein LOC108603737 isoform X2 [Drosophila busckii]